jgi:hypothetical protein
VEQRQTERAEKEEEEKKTIMKEAMTMAATIIVSLDTESNRILDGKGQLLLKLNVREK